MNLPSTSVQSVVMSPLLLLILVTCTFAFSPEQSGQRIINSAQFLEEPAFGFIGFLFLFSISLITTL